MIARVVAVMALVLMAQAASISWTGIVNNNQWNTPNNWYPNQVPGPNDDVTIEKGIVEVTTATAVSSLSMGTNVDTPANLTLYHAFSVGASGLTIHGNGNLMQSSGQEAVTGPVSCEGTYTLVVGVVAGPWTISSKGSVFFNGGGEKNLVAAQFSVAGTIEAEGIIAFNKSSVLTLTGTMNIGGKGLQFADVDGAVGNHFDGSAGSVNLASGLLSFQANAVLGKIAITAGANVQVFRAVSFPNALLIPATSTVSSVGNANATFVGEVYGSGSLNAGGRLTTLNSLNISALAISGGQVEFLGNVSTADTISLTGGTANFPGTLNGGSCTLTGGILASANGGQLVCGDSTLNSKGLNLGATLVVAKSMSIAGASLISFQKAVGALSINAGATVSVTNGLQLTGPAGTPGVNNQGTITIAAPTSANNVDIKGTGSLVVSSVLSTQSCTLDAGNVALDTKGSIKGSMTSLSLTTVSAPKAAGSEVLFKAGDYSLACPVSCSNIDASASAQSFMLGAK